MILIKKQDYNIIISIFDSWLIVRNIIISGPLFNFNILNSFYCYQFIYLYIGQQNVYMRNLINYLHMSGMNNRTAKYHRPVIHPV